MEGKPILLCLMVLVLLGHSTHAGKCHNQRAYSNPFFCQDKACHVKCVKNWGKLLVHSSCKTEGFFKISCICVFCDL
uniref:Knottin scorpion toxin-like domain-containing protein n=1 Tax=Aegilops tauschii subsp. strangulata TaxID=200361 RepID=A0A453GL18_AEGTS